MTQAKVNTVVTALSSFGLCWLTNPIAFVVSVCVWVVARLPLPIPEVEVNLPPQVCADCVVRAGLLARIVYMHTQQGK